MTLNVMWPSLDCVVGKRNIGCVCDCYETPLGLCTKQLQCKNKSSNCIKAFTSA